MKKKLAVFCTAAVMTFASAAPASFSVFRFNEPVTVSARIVNSGYCGENVLWTLNDQGTVTISGTGNMKDYEYNRSPWHNSSTIKKVVVLDGVTSLGDYSFYGCTELETVELPDDLTVIGENAISSCYKLKNLNIPKHLTTIRDCAMFETQIEHLDLPDTLTYIGEYAFVRCRLKSVNMSNNIRHIGRAAFHDMWNTQPIEITIPDRTDNLKFEDILEFAGDAVFSRTNVVIYGSKNSYAETFAKHLEAKFVETPYIKDITSVYGNTKQEALDKCPPGYSIITHDLNAWAGGAYIYLCYSRTAKSSEATTDLKMYQGTSAYYNDIVLNNRTYKNGTVNLNKGSGGLYLYLYSTKSTRMTPIKKISVVYHNPVLSGYSYVTWFNNNNAADANESVGGNKTYFEIAR